MKSLIKILENLETKKDSYDGSFFIPEIWNCSNFEQFDTNKNRPREIDVNPYKFIINCIKNSIISKVDNLTSLGCRDYQAGIQNSIIYCMFPRMFTAWNHTNSGEIRNGTLLKAICLLPYLKSINIDTVYLLPVFDHSNIYKKGEIGSPYSIKNVYKLDSNLHDDLLGEYSEELIDTEFKAFVEACHILGIKVMVDFVFRTVARDSDLIMEHPEWFYWIDLKYNDTFCVPNVDSLGQLTNICDEVIPNLYTCNGIKEYLTQFTYAPNLIDKEKWESILDEQKKSGDSILRLIETNFNITTAPAFPPVINDNQPPWEDVTYLKFYFDAPGIVKEYLEPEQVPYILMDIAKQNIYHEEPGNTELWSYIVNVIPYYQKNFGIDGARVDMGHALPQKLNMEIIQKARANNHNFIFWSEEFDTGKSYEAKEDGFNFMSGFLWSAYKYVNNADFYNTIAGAIMSSAIPSVSCLETPDTPRAAFRYRSRSDFELMIMLSYFMPNTIPMINNGMECFEIQPMNLGLENTEEGKLVLDKDDSMYGKLAFFDNYRMHWTNEESVWMKIFLEKAAHVREQVADTINNKDNFVYQYDFLDKDRVLNITYVDHETGKCVFLLANKDNEWCTRVNLNTFIPYEIDRSKSIRLLLKDGELNDNQVGYDEIELRPRSVTVGIII